MNFDIFFSLKFSKFLKFSGFFVPVPFCQLVRIWTLFLSICIDSKDLQSNFEVPVACGSLIFPLPSTVIFCSKFLHFFSCRMFAYLLFSPASILGQKDAISMETDRQPDPSAPHSTGKSLSEALIFASTNPQYDDRLFIELQVQYMKIPSSSLGRTCCVQKLFLTFRTIYDCIRHVLPHVLQI